MKIELRDPLLKRYLTLPLIVLAVILVVFFGVNHFFSGIEQQLSQQTRSKTGQLNSILNQVRFLEHQQHLFERFGEKYKNFLKDGLVYRQDRVKWTDELLKIKQNLVLFPFSIQFEPEKKLTKENASNLVMEKDIFYSTNLNMNFGLHSDLDIVLLFDEIMTRITSFYLIKGCDLKADITKLEEVKFDPASPNINANCTIVLFQVKPREFKLDNNS